MTDPNAVVDDDNEWRRRNSNGSILCMFCDELATLQNCCFWPATQDDSSISGPFDLCLAHFKEREDSLGSTGEESAIPFPDRTTSPHP